MPSSRPAVERMPLAESDRTFRSFFECNPQPMFLLDVQTFRYLAVNDAALALYGYSREEFLALRQTDLRADDQADQLLDDRVEVRLGSKTHFGDTRHRTKGGLSLDVELDIAHVVFASRDAVVVVVSDVTDRVRLQHELQYRAFHDGLTGLPNRALFTDRVDHALASAARDGRSLAVLFLDLDNFKAINDGLGHAAGDELLKTVAQRLREQLRTEDTAARFGGDEFAVLLEHITDPSQVAHVCQRIAAALRVGCHIQGTPVFAQVSIGVTYSSDGATAEELLRNADMAMYGAKANGKSCFLVFEPVMHQRVAQRLKLESDLRRALDDGHLRVYYQPVFELPGQRIVGVEALVRWLHPDRGMILPLDFIPVAEDTGLIVPLGRWVLKEACAQVRRWQQEIAGLQDLNGAVNISPRQLDDPAIVRHVQEALAASGLRPEKLVLEITESILMRDVAAAAARLEDLSDLGVKLAVDDFGTGQSSLSQLRRFPVDILKIDKSFVDNIDRDPMASKLLTVVAGLGASLGLDVVAEGVESAAQAAIIEGLGTLYVQGYLYSRPLDGDAMTEFLSAPERSSVR
ncbi:MAG: putative bifunctional diguanylate cyclase/phosphodiesterase [Candidatus Dormibacteria bacterium]